MTASSGSPLRLKSLLLVAAFVLQHCLVTTNSQETRCGCNQCTAQVLQSQAGNGATCEDRIDAELAIVRDPPVTEAEACAVVSSRYPDQECGPFCHPEKCDGRAPAHCNCASCTTQVWNTQSGEGSPFACGDLVKLQVDANSLSELEACEVVSERPVCSACDPNGDQCALPTSVPTTMPVTPPPTVAPTLPEASPTRSPITATTPSAPCGCFACDENVLNNTAGGFTCKQRIDYLQTKEGGLLSELESCRIVAEEFPDNVCGPACHPTNCTTLAPTMSPTLEPPEMCDCYDCNETVLNTTVAGFTCGERIRYLQTSAGGRYTEEGACDFVAREFRICSGCGPQVCDGRSGASLQTTGYAFLATSALALLML